MSLIRCEFKGERGVILILEKSQYEPEITEETLRNFNSNKYQNRIEIIKTTIGVHYLAIHVDNVARHLIMENVYFDIKYTFYINIRVQTPNNCRSVSVFELEVVNCRTSATIHIRISLILTNSFAKFRFENTLFEEIYLSSEQHAGLASFVFDNCTFIKALRVDIEQFIDFKILGSFINVPFDCDGHDCMTHLTGFSTIKDYAYYFFDRVKGTSTSYLVKTGSRVHIENTSFQGAHGPFFTIQKAELFISESVFQIQNQRSPIQNLIDFQAYHSLELNYVTIRLTSIDRELQQINIISAETSMIEVQNTHIFCPPGMNAIEERLQLRHKSLNSYRCEAACTSNIYTYQSGNITFDYYACCVDHHDTDNLNKLNAMIRYSIREPICSKCPVGAKCSGNIKALPNYWGYRKKDEVVMIRCPTGYCCQDDKSCQSFHSCNSNRSGPLCGVYEKGFAESIFDAASIPVEKCYTWFLVLLYISCIVGYGLGLMVIDNIKGAVISPLKKIYQCIKRIVLKNVKPNQKSEKSDSSKMEVKEEGSFKYLQILFYYVQDAALFKIELPGKETEQTSTFVKILQLTPDVLTSIYDSMTETCFGFGTTAVSKILFKSIFGPCIVTFLFIVYLCQSCIFIVTRKESKLRSLIKFKLVQSFVLVILLSYQQIVTGAFTLVKCIDIGNISRLYIQGNIKCFTHWQNIIEIFIWMNIFPSFFVFSHVPYYVQMKQMSVQMFIIVCLLHVPGLMIFHMNKAWNKFKKRYSAQNYSDIELNTIVKSKRVVRVVRKKEISSIVSGTGSNLSLSNTVCNDTLDVSSVTSDSDTDIANEYSTDLMIHFKTDSKQATLAEEEEVTTDTDRCSKQSSELDSKDRNVVDSKEAITETLLKHYKTMMLFGISFNWLAIHKFYRMILVACNTYIYHSIVKLCTMTFFLLGIMLLHCLLKPYKKRPANVTGALYFVANCIIAIINLIKAVMSEYGCQINCSDKSKILGYLDTGEQVLLVYVPIASICLWLLSTMLLKCVRKLKKE